MSRDLITEVQIFKDLSPAYDELLAQLFIPYAAVEGETLFEQGEPSESFFVLMAGEVAIRYKPEDGPAITVTRVKPQGVIGWSAILGSPLYTSSAVCTSGCNTLRVRSSDLRALCAANPAVGALLLDRLAGLIAQRLHQTRTQVMKLLREGMNMRLQVAAPSTI
ncbi:MAG TPA: Crp/Fnr family transcriptional regulator [Anaerolineales bacterium]|nr:Crp/Fnr family transcriptional regulator [Anaerolineales bacterium]